jgi:hypothetical protein
MYRGGSRAAGAAGNDQRTPSSPARPFRVGSGGPTSRLRQMRVLLAALVWSLACHHPTPPAPPSPDAASALPDAAPGDAARAPRDAGTADLGAPADAGGPAPRTSLILGTSRGLREIDGDGHLLRTLTRVRASSPRWVDSDALIYLGPNAREVRRYTLEDGRDERLVSLPALDCPGARRPLALQAPDDFQVDADGTRACLNLQDRNDNAAGVAVSAELDLPRRSIRLRQAVGDQPCRKVEPGDFFTCTPPPPRHRPHGPSAPLPYDFAEGWLIKGRAKVRQLPGFDNDAAGVSPSGRWLVLALAGSEGDLLHRTLLLLDRRSAELFPVRDGQWPPPLDAAGLEKMAKGVIDPRHSLDVLGESDVRWLDLPADVLLVDRRLIRPGKSTIKVDGDVAR